MIDFKMLKLGMKKLGKRDFKVYVCLVTFNGSNNCFPSRKIIAEMNNMKSVSCISEALSNLEKAFFIKRNKRAGRSNIYTLLTYIEYQQLTRPCLSNTPPENTEGYPSEKPEYYLRKTRSNPSGKTGDIYNNIYNNLRETPPHILSAVNFYVNERQKIFPNFRITEKILKELINAFYTLLEVQKVELDLLKKIIGWSIQVPSLQKFVLYPNYIRDNFERLMLEFNSSHINQKQRPNPPKQTEKAIVIVSPEGEPKIWYLSYGEIPEGWKERGF